MQINGLIIRYENLNITKMRQNMEVFDSEV